MRFFFLFKKKSQLFIHLNSYIAFISSVKLSQYLCLPPNVNFKPPCFLEHFEDTIRTKVSTSPKFQRLQNMWVSFVLSTKVLKIQDQTLKRRLSFKFQQALIVMNLELQPFL